MHPEDAHHLASTIKTVGYHEWVDIPNKIVYQSCCDCGLSHAIMVELPDPDAIPEAQLRVRFILEEQLTDANRESDRLELSLYRELKRLREENINLKRQLEQENGDRSTSDKASDRVRSSES